MLNCRFLCGPSDIMNMNDLSPLLSPIMELHLPQYSLFLSPSLVILFLDKSAPTVWFRFCRWLGFLSSALSSCTTSKQTANTMHETTLHGADPPFFLLTFVEGLLIVA